MKVTFLGTGTSSGVPVIGCKCFTCTSDDNKNNRTRSSVLLSLENGKNILIDTAVELRQQMIKNDVNRVDAVIYTHAHADHVHGLDDIRFFNMRQQKQIPCYGNKLAVNSLAKMYYYIFEDGQIGGGKPDITLNEVNDKFVVENEIIVPVAAYHGTLPIFGYRVRDFAYLTDVNSLPESSFELLKGLDVLVLGALRKTPHPTHYSVDEALEVIERIKPKKAYLTHIGHKLEHVQTSQELPEDVLMAYDGLEINI